MMKKYTGIILIVVMFLLISIPSVYAYMFKKTQVVENKFEPAVVKCNVVEEFANSTKTSVKVENTGNVNAYIRVFALVCWQDSKGNVTKKYANTAGAELPELETAANWIEYEDNVYYYKLPVEPGKLTGEFLSKDISLKAIQEEIGGVVYEYNQVVHIVAEAIQANPTSTVKDAWNVKLDANGNITK